MPLYGVSWKQANKKLPFHDIEGKKGGGLILVVGYE
jgi:hypothetical protein